MDSLRVPVTDTSGDLVKKRFLSFLQNFYNENPNLHNYNHVEDIENEITLHDAIHDYMQQIVTMIQNTKSTLYVDFQDISSVSQFPH